MHSQIALSSPRNVEQQLPLMAGLPGVGVLPSLLADPFGLLARAQKKHGDIFTLNLGLTKLVMLTHPRHAQHVLVEHAQNYRKGGAIWDSVRTLVGNGLVVSEGDFWLRQRRMMQPQFHRQRLAALTSLMVEAIDGALDRWQPAATSDGVFDLLPAFNELTMQVIVKTLFGAAVSRAELGQVAESMAFALDYLLPNAATGWLPAWVPVPGRARYRRELARFDEIVYRIIADGRRSQGENNHLLAMLLDVVDDETGAGMDDRQLRDEVATLFLAGYETTSIALSWAFHYLVQQPEMLARLLAEADAVLGQRLPSFADLPQLGYARMVLQEAMRLRPPAYFLPRTAVADDEIDGYAIPAGANVVTLPFMIHRHPQEWPDAERFDPERFTPERSTGRHKLAWMPFGAGQRMCIGRDFALMEGTLALAMLAQRYTVEAIPGRTAQLSMSITLRPKGGVAVRLTPR